MTLTANTAIPLFKTLAKVLPLGTGSYPDRIALMLRMAIAIKETSIAERTTIKPIEGAGLVSAHAINPRTRMIM
jgi:hypothetical protein